MWRKSRGKGGGGRGGGERERTKSQVVNSGQREYQEGVAGPQERTKVTQISVLRQNNFNGSDSSAKRQPDNCYVCSFLV